MAEPFIAKLLRPEQVLLKLSGRDRDEVIHELVAGIREFRDQPAEREKFAQAVLEREKMHSTAVGEGIALPHARNQQPNLLPDPVLVFGRHERGISFGAVDNKPVQLFLLISAPNLTQHLNLLAVLSRCLRGTPLRQELLKATTPQRVVELLVEAEKNLHR
jgi:mannitol/fructose-specific phosphotransferase system IIA component (Ntr-type)